MEIRARHDGGDLPFERERRLVLRRIPVGAVVHDARLTLTPRSADPTGRFLETIGLPPGTGRGDWGTTKVVTGTSVEIDLHARRRLAALESTGVAGAPLLVDIGGGFLDLAADGGLGPGAPFTVLNGTTVLPGMLATGLRLLAGGDVSSVTVASPPSNLSVSFEGGPAVLSTIGDLVSPVTAEVGAVLAALLPEMEVVDGCHELVVVVRSESISRLDVELTVDLALAGPAAPGGVRTVRASYQHDGTPVAGQGALGVAVPAGMSVAAVSGRVQGAFDGTRVVLGPPAGVTLPVPVAVDAGQGLAHPFVPATSLVASAVDLLLTAVTGAAELSVDLVADQDGKPGRTSLLGRPATVRLSRDVQGAPTWVSLRLAAPLDLAAGARLWLTVQSVDGRATWSAGPAQGADAAGPGLQQTLDGRLSWRAVRDPGPVAGPAPAPGPLGAGMRLRHTPDSYRVPLELLVSAAGTSAAVSLQRFAPTGAVDLDLAVPEVAAGMNAVVASAGGAGGAGMGEAVANGDFSDWYRVGRAVRGSRSLTPPDGAVPAAATPAFTPDGARALVLTRGLADGVPRTARLLAVDPLSGEVTGDTEVAQGEPTALVVEPGGQRALVATVTGGDTGAASAGWLVPVDLATGLPAGSPIALPELVLRAVTSADGGTLWLAGFARSSDPDGGASGVVVRAVPWARLAAGAGAPDWEALPHAAVPGLPQDLAASISGGAVLVTRSASAAPATVHSWADPSALASDDDARLEVPGAVAVAGTLDGTALVLTDTRLIELDDRLRTVRELPLPAGGQAQSLVLDPMGELGLIGRLGDLLVLDLARSRLTPADASPPAGDDPLRLAFSPAGTHALAVRGPLVQLLTVGDALPDEWELTAGTVRPASLGDGEVVALLGRETSRKQPGPPEASALSQVVPVRGGARHRFAFDGIALVEGATLEVRWTAGACTTARTDRVPVPVLDVTRRSGLDSLPHVEQVLVAPTGAVQAEVRVLVPEGQAAVDHVSLSGTVDALGPSWQASSPALGQLSQDALVLSNGGAAPASTAQVVAVTAGARFELEVRAVAVGQPGAAVRLVFGDDRGAAVGAPVVVPLDVLDLDLHGASGVVPDGAVEVEVAVVVPVGASVTVRSASFSVAAPLDLDLTFTSEAPGELTITDVVVQLDEVPPAPMPVPDGGLCPVTPGAGGADDCHCQVCGTSAPAGKARAAVTAAGRPATVAPCSTCGAARIRLGGAVVAGAAPVALPRFRAVDRTPPVTAGSAVTSRAAAPAALVSRVRVDVPLTEVAGIGAVRAGELAALGVSGVADLARAPRSMVASLRGVSERGAAAIIASAAGIVDEKGERVLFG